LFDAAKRLGHPIRVHADQFTSHGMVESAIRLGARSVDHLEASTAETRSAIAESDTFAVGLPICGFHLDGRYARLGDIVNAGGKVCVATNYNPGSAPSPSMPLAIALAVRHCGLTPEQAIVAATLNPACLLGLDRRGYIAQDAWADLILLHHTDERALPYEVGGNPVAMVIIRGVVQE
jgi:imidazolonepropionase